MNGDVHRALLIFKELEEHKDESMRPKLATYTSMIGTYANAMIWCDKSPTLKSEGEKYITKAAEFFQKVINNFLFMNFNLDHNYR
jgi:hypothetical protein